MQTLILRALKQRAIDLLHQFPAVAILGPRQCGKSTLSAEILAEFGNAIYLDLERPSDRDKLKEPELFLGRRQQLVCMDEIQRMPEIFEVLRSLIDETKKPGQYLILGSASGELLKQSSESLAGRIAYLELTPFTLAEVKDVSTQPLEQLWFRGGFPLSFLATSDQQSVEWRSQFVRTFLEQDIPSLGISIPPATLRRFWQMCAHNHAQLLNRSKLGDALGVSHHTIQRYLDILEQTFMVRSLQPFFVNMKKRLVKSPRIYFRDTGILHSLLGINSMDQLFGHPSFGDSWEGLVIENVLSTISRDVHASFYRTSDGSSEIDLILEYGRKRIGIECKASVTPKLAPGFWTAMKDLELSEAFVVCPVKNSYPLAENVTVMSLEDVPSRLA